MIEEITEVEPHWAEAYRAGGHNRIYLYIKGDASLLDTDIPEDAHALGQVFDDAGEYLRQKTVLEFIGGENGYFWRLDDGNVIFLACAMDSPVIRQKRMTTSDADQWKAYADAVWGDEYEFLTHDEVLKLTGE